MGYVLNAIIGSRALLLGARVAEDWDVCVVDLGQGLGMLPVSDELNDRVCAVDGDRMGFWLLPGGFGDVLAGWSCSGPVAYVEADYFGGVGEQRAAVWDAGRLALGPLCKGVDGAFPVEGSPISQALRYLGVQRANMMTSSPRSGCYAIAVLRPGLKRPQRPVESSP